MPFNFTNKAKVSLAIAPFLALDTYEYDPDPKAISATSLIRPLRAVILGRQNVDLAKDVELIDMAGPSMGSAFHARLELGWNNPALIKAILEKFGNSPEVISRVRVNPPEIKKGDIAIYTEQRFHKEISGFKVTGQCDLIINGHLHDLKSSSVYGYINDSNAHDYIAQGSVYRWLRPDLITEDDMFIEYLFTDWSKQQAIRDKAYPQLRVMQKKYELWSLEATENYIEERLQTIAEKADKPQQELPLCNERELWQQPVKYQYFKNPNSARATRNYDTMQEAQDHLSKNNGVGEVRVKPGKVNRCNYCPVVDICEQAASLKQQGLLE